MSKSAGCGLTKPYRSDSKQLLALWDNMLRMEENVLDRLQVGEFLANLAPSIFTSAEDNEIIFCLNYGGLYGINHINYFMQENNKRKYGGGDTKWVFPFCLMILLIGVVDLINYQNTDLLACL